MQEHLQYTTVAHCLVRNAPEQYVVVQFCSDSKVDPKLRLESDLNLIYSPVNIIYIFYPFIKTWTFLSRLNCSARQVGMDYEHSRYTLSVTIFHIFMINDRGREYRVKNAENCSRRYEVNKQVCHGVKGGRLGEWWCSLLVILPLWIVFIVLLSLKIAVIAQNIYNFCCILLPDIRIPKRPDIQYNPSRECSEYPTKFDIPLENRPLILFITIWAPITDWWLTKHDILLLRQISNISAVFSHIASIVTGSSNHQNSVSRIFAYPFNHCCGSWSGLNVSPGSWSGKRNKSGSLFLKKTHVIIFLVM